MSIRTATFNRVSWATEEGAAAKTATVRELTGTIVRVDIVISEVTDNPTVDVSFLDGNGLAIVPAFDDLADGTHHVKLARSHKVDQDADFNPMPVCAETLTVSVDPSADPGGEVQLLTVDVKLYLED